MADNGPEQNDRWLETQETAEDKLDAARPWQIEPSGTPRARIKRDGVVPGVIGAVLRARQFFSSFRDRRAKFSISSRIGTNFLLHARREPNNKMKTARREISSCSRVFRPLKFYVSPLSRATSTVLCVCPA